MSSDRRRRNTARARRVRNALAVLLAFASGACMAPTESPPDDRGELALGVSLLTASERRARAAQIRDAAFESGMTQGYLLAGIADAETNMSHCWSELTWACQGPPSPDCGGGPVVAGAGDGPCSIQQGGLGMFQFDAGTYADTLRREGERILYIDGNVQAAVDFVVSMLIRSVYVDGVDDAAQAIAWTNGVRPGNERWDPWIRTVTHYYNGCTPSASCWSSRHAHYLENTTGVHDEMGEAFWAVNRDFAAQYVHQSFPLASEPLELQPNAELAGYIEMRNTGTETWSPGATFLGTTQPRDGDSPLAGADWLAPHRAATVDRVVAPGETGRFAFTLQAPAEAGEYPQFFNLVQENVAWFGDRGGPPDDQLQVRVIVVPQRTCPADGRENWRCEGDDRVRCDGGELVRERCEHGCVAAGGGAVCASETSPTSDDLPPRDAGIQPEPECEAGPNSGEQCADAGWPHPDAGAGEHDGGTEAKANGGGDGGCTAVPGAPARGSSPWLLALALAALRCRRRAARGRRGAHLAHAASVIALGALIAGCVGKAELSNAQRCDHAPAVAVTSHALSSVDCTETRDTGYSNGMPFSISVVTVDGENVERETANAYYVMAQAADRDGVSLHVVSGFRTMAEQERLYACYLDCNCNNCNLAARPGYSNHQSGHALDLNASAPGVLQWLETHAASFGFERTVPSENWHWEWWGGGPGGGPCGVEYAGKSLGVSGQSHPIVSHGPVTIAVGETASGWVRLENAGSATWQPGVVWLAPIPRDSPSPFASASWHSPQRISTVSAEVAPGEVGEFALDITGQVEGRAILSLGWVAEERTWFADAPLGGGPDDGYFAVDVEVVADDPADPADPDPADRAQDAAPAGAPPASDPGTALPDSGTRNAARDAGLPAGAPPPSARDAGARHTADDERGGCRAMPAPSPWRVSQSAWPWALAWLWLWRARRRR